MRIARARCYNFLCVHRSDAAKERNKALESHLLNTFGQVKKKKRRKREALEVNLNLDFVIDLENVTDDDLEGRVRVKNATVVEKSGHGDGHGRAAISMARGSLVGQEIDLESFLASDRSFSSFFPMQPLLFRPPSLVSSPSLQPTQEGGKGQGQAAAAFRGRRSTR